MEAACLEAIQSIQDPYAFEKILIEQNPFTLIQGGFLKIKVKNPENDAFIVPFHPKPAQNRLNSLIIELSQAGIPPRIWVLKARQEGISTDSDGAVFAHTSQKRGVNSLIIADDDDGANYLLDMCKLFHSELQKDYPHLCPEKKRSNRKELVFSGIHSQILIDTANNINAGRKYTFQYAHLSEVAFYSYPEELMFGLLQSVPRSPNTFIIGESTANGVGNYFHREVIKAQRGETDWRLLFVPWFEEPTYQIKLYDKQRDHITRTLTPAEEHLIKQYDLSLEQLYWRRDQIVNQCGGINLSLSHNYLTPDETDIASMDKFNQENPATVEEAFITSGRSIFSQYRLKQMYAVAPRKMKFDPRTKLPSEPLRVGINYAPGWLVKDLNGNIGFVPDPNGPWQIFDLPRPDVEYVMGADVAEGIDVGVVSSSRLKRGIGQKKFDYSTIKIRRRDTMAEVACFRAYIDADKFKDQIKWACLIYNEMVAAVEGNIDHGIHVLRELAKEYSLIYMSEVMDEKFKKPRKKLGWLTTSKTKGIMVDTYAALIRDAEITIRSTNGIHEAETFETKPDGSMGAAEGCHDDEVIADMICIQMNKLLPHAVDYTRKIMVA